MVCDSGVFHGVRPLGIGSDIWIVKQKSKPWQRPKKKKALWMGINDPTFKAQREQLRPEHSKAGGIKARSVPEKIRMDIYNPIADLFKQVHPLCQACPKTGLNRWKKWTEDIHHKAGREGLRLFDTRDWIAVCRDCHNWIHANPAKAKELGLLK